MYRLGGRNAWFGWPSSIGVFRARVRFVDLAPPVVGAYNPVLQQESLLVAKLAAHSSRLV